MTKQVHSDQHKEKSVSAKGSLNDAYSNDYVPPAYSTVVDVDSHDVTVANEEVEEGDDPWALAEPKITGKPWKEMTVKEKVKRVIMNILKGCGILLLLYFFICSIDILGASFQLIGEGDVEHMLAYADKLGTMKTAYADLLGTGKTTYAGRTAGEAFTRSELLNNPVCGLMIGVGVTVLLQSSSTSTSIVVTMVAAQIIPVRQAIYIIMGANIGTSVTNTIVAMGQIANRDQFRRAFAGATVHDMFNWLAVLVLLPIEVATGYLYYSTLAMVQNINVEDTDVDEPQFLKVITKPFTDAIIKVDKDVIYGIAEEAFVQKRPLTRYLCKEELQTFYQDFPLGTDVPNTELYKSLKENLTHPNYWVRDELIQHIEVPANQTNITSSDGGPVVNVTRFSWEIPSFSEETDTKSCTHWFVGAGLPSQYDAQEGWPSLNMSDVLVGCVLVIASLLLLCICLVGMVKILKSLLQGPVLKVVRNVINADITFPDCCPGCCNVFGKELTGYITMLTGAGLTILVQSSSVFTSAITPLVGMGIITVERMYPLTLGANIGTTVTSLLAAFTSDPETIRDALQVSLAHLLFNLSGIAIFYPVPFMRKIPVLLAKKLGNTTAKYRWFAIAYLIVVFFIAPFLVFALSIPGWYVLAAVLIPLALIVAFVVTVNISQDKCPKCLPKRLQSWYWCPTFLCSLEPYDRLFKKCFKCCTCCTVCQDEDNNVAESLDTKEISHGIKMQYKNGDLKTISNGDVFKNGDVNKGFDGGNNHDEHCMTTL